MSSDCSKLQTAILEGTGIPVMKIAGEVDVYTADQLKTALNQVIVFGAKDLVIDMGEVSYIDSHGFGTLLEVTRILKSRGGSLNLASCSASIERLLRITKLDMTFGIFQNVGGAIESMTAESV